VEHFPLLDIVIGLSLIYTFLSLLASELTEFVITVLKWRAQCFQRGITVLLGESAEIVNHSDSFKDTIAGKVWNRLQINSATYSFNGQNRSIILPAVPPQLFATALLEVLQDLPVPNPVRIENKISSVAAIAQIKLVINSSPDLSPQLQANLQRMINRVQRIEPDAEQQMARLQHEIGIWFSHAMMETSNAYKKDFKLITFFVSLILVIAINIDSLYIIRRVSENTATRAVVLHNATQIQACRHNLSSLDCKERVSILMESTTIPLGWQPSNRQKQFARLNRVVILRTIGGWLLTSLAIAMGSRFWLHLLHRFVKRR
jgi:hypothetical protein